MTPLKLVPLDDVVVFPGMPVTLPADVGSDPRVLLIPRRGSGYAKVGVVAEVSERVALGGRGVASFMPLHRGVPGAAQTGPDGVLRVDVDERPDVTPPPDLTRDLEREYRAVVEEILELRGDDGRISAFVRSITHPGSLADTAGYSPDLNVDQKLELLETLDVVERLTLALRFQQERLAELRVRKRIRDEVESGAQKQQREYLLRRQMDAIRKELGENEGSVAEEYRKKIAAAGMPEAVQQQAERELARFERMGESNAEGSMIRTYLDWLLAVPWSKRSEERLDPAARARGAGRRPRRPRRREAAHHRVSGGPEAARRARPDRRSPVGRHSDADRSSGNGQDLDRRVDRPGHRPAVRPHVPGRRARRGRDPRASPHVYRRAAGPARARARATRAR